MLKNPERIYPLRKGEWIIEEDHVVLLRPKSRFRVLRWLWGEKFRIHLDEKGSFVWRHLTGEFSVEEIARMLEREFSLEDALQRTEQFLLSLYRGGFLEFRESLSGEGNT